MWLLPSRRRLANLHRFFEAYKATGTSTPGVLLINTGDYSDNAAEYDKLADDLPPNWFIHYCKGDTQGEKISEIWDEVKDCAWLGLIGDDCVPETMHWDRLLIEPLDGSNFVSCDDGWQAPKRVGNCWAISGDLVRAVGYIFPPALQHLFVDDVWETIGREAGCWTRVMSVMVRHRHVLKGETAEDETHEKVYGKDYAARVAAGEKPDDGLWQWDKLVFMAWLRDDDRHIAVDAAVKLRESRGASVPPMPAVHTAERSAEERFEYAKTRKCMILTPVGRNPSWKYTDSYGKTIAALERAGIEWDRRFVIGNSDVARARNDLAAQYLLASADDPSWDAMWIDDDMNWEAGSVIRCLASKEAFVGAAGRKRIAKPNSDPGVWCVYLPEGQILDEMGNVSAPGAKVGGAFFRTRREVFERMVAAHPYWKLPALQFMSPEAGAYYYEFFRQDDPWTLTDEMRRAGQDAVARGEGIEAIFRSMLQVRPWNNGGEDFTFCDRWNALGGRVWVDPSITLGHVGEHEYRGALCELLLSLPGKENPHVKLLAGLTNLIEG